MSDPRLLFFAHFVEAYTLRNVLANIYKEVSQMSMFLSKTGILISVINQQKYATIELKIKTSELQEYQYNLEDEAYPIGLSTQSMMVATKPIGRRDGVKIYMLKSEPILYVQTVTSSSGGRNSQPVSKIHEVAIDGHQCYEIPPFLRGEDDPNVCIQAKDFSLMCNSMNIHKCVKVEAHPYRNGIMFIGIDGNDSDVRHEPFGNVPPDQAPEGSIRIPIKTIKALAKINAFSAAISRIKIYYQEKSPLKIVSQVGTYGTFTIMLRDAP